MHNQLRSGGYIARPRLMGIPGLRLKGLQMTKRPSLGVLTAPNWQAPNGCVAVLIIACSANCQNLSVADVQETGVCWGNLCVAAVDFKTTVSPTT